MTMTSSDLVEGDGQAGQIITTCVSRSKVQQSKKRKTSKAKCDRYLSDGLWFEILSRSSIKSLIKCASVCKEWRVMSSELLSKLKSLDCLPLPTCGFICKAISHTGENHPRRRIYINHGEENVNGMHSKVFKNLVLDSHREKGLLRGSKFDFRPIKDGAFFAIHNGLLLVVDHDCTYHVHNPATRESITLPKSPTIAEYTDTLHEKTGFIINFSNSPFSKTFGVVRICRQLSKVEAFYSSRGEWWTRNLKCRPLQILKPKWCMENYVVLYSTKTIYFLTEWHYGVAIRLRTSSIKSIPAYGFLLPEVARRGFRNGVLGECRGVLYLSYYNSNGVWIWKHVGSPPEVVSIDTWVPLFEISNVGKLCKQVAQEHLVKVVEAGDVVVPMGFHPNVDVIAIFRIKTSIFSYNLETDTLNKIVELDNRLHKSRRVAIPYTPCFISLNNLEKVMPLAVGGDNDEVNPFSVEGAQIWPE